MASTEALAKRMAAAHRRTEEVIAEHGPAERVTNLEQLGRPTTQNPMALAAYQAEMMAALAEVVDQQAKSSAKKSTRRSS